MIKKKSTSERSSLKEKLRGEVKEILTSALSAYKAELGEKKFDKRIRKAAKIFSHGMDTFPATNQPVTKPVLKKAAKVPAKKAARKIRPSIKRSR